MFPARYFAPRHFAARYFAPAGRSLPPGSGYFPPRHFGDRYFAGRYFPHVAPLPALTGLAALIAGDLALFDTSDLDLAGDLALFD